MGFSFWKKWDSLTTIVRYSKKNLSELSGHFAKQINQVADQINQAAKQIKQAQAVDSVDPSIFSTAFYEEHKKLVLAELIKNYSIKNCPIKPQHVFTTTGFNIAERSDRNEAMHFSIYSIFSIEINGQPYFLDSKTQRLKLLSQKEKQGLEEKINDCLRELNSSKLEHCQLLTLMQATHVMLENEYSIKPIVSVGMQTLYKKHDDQPQTNCEVKDFIILSTIENVKCTKAFRQENEPTNATEISSAVIAIKNARDLGQHYNQYFKPNAAKVAIEQNIPKTAKPKQNHINSNQDHAYSFAPSLLVNQLPAATPSKPVEKNGSLLDFIGDLFNKLLTAIFAPKKIPSLDEQYADLNKRRFAEVGIVLKDEAANHNHHIRNRR